MNKFLISFGDGPHEELLRIATPSFKAFADRHNYNLFLPKIDFVRKNIQNATNGIDGNLYWRIPFRPQSWLKVPLIHFCYDVMKADIVLWVDSDIVIVNNQDDPYKYLSDNIQGMVHHLVPEGTVPNCGVWITSRDIYRKRYLETVWDMSEHTNHPWWEQKSVIKLMEEDSHLKEKTVDLPYKFNVHKNDFRGMPLDKAFLHATMYGKERAAIMRKWAGEAK